MARSDASPEPGVVGSALDDDVDDDVDAGIFLLDRLLHGAAKRSDRDARIDWSRPAVEVHDLVRAQSDPYPNAHAVHAVADAVRRARAGLKDPKRPIGTFLFLGPSGVGKTELARALAELLFDDENAMVRLVSETPFGKVHELQGEVLHAGAHLTNHVAKVVVEGCRWNGGPQSKSGCDQRLMCIPRDFMVEVTWRVLF